MGRRRLTVLVALLFLGNAFAGSIGLLTEPIPPVVDGPGDPAESEATTATPPSDGGTAASSASFDDGRTPPPTEVGDDKLGYGGGGEAVADEGHGHAASPGHRHADSSGEQPPRPQVPGPGRGHHGVENRSDPGTPPDRDGLEVGVGSGDRGGWLLPGPMASTVSVPEADGPGSPCPDDAPVRSFTIHAIQVDIVYNKYGVHDPNGRMYVLDENLEEVREKVRSAPNATLEDPDPNATTRLVQPLTIRAYEGECIDIDFVNHLDQPSSIHVAGTSYGIDGSDGRAVGFNDESVAEPEAEPGHEKEYRWYAHRTGAYPFWDGANPVMHDEDETLKQHGLFGALVVEEKGTDWLDPRTGNHTRSGVQAMIEDPDGPDYREFAVFYHGGADPVRANGEPITWPHSDSAEVSHHSMNYRGDSTGMRLREDCADCHKEKSFYSSWVHGDPGGGDLVFPAYVGDPIKYHLIGANTEEKHVHHHHGHRFKSEPTNTDSNTIDAQTISAGSSYTQPLIAGHGAHSVRPNMTFEEAFETGGGGYVQGSPGDYIFHCHLFPHYATGMWSLLRVFDKDTREMNSSHPAIREIQPLPDRQEPEEPTDEEPGYPLYMPAEQGQQPPRPPSSGNGRNATDLEQSALDGNGTPGKWDRDPDPIQPGAPYSDPCPEDAEVRRYNVTAFDTNITYNDAGDYDPDARIYALDKHVDDIESGERRPRPLALRAHQGECVEIRLTNELFDTEEPNDMTMHVHFVGYDVQGSDGLTLGWNYDQGVEPGEDPIYYRWYADERGTIFWHDHHSGIQKGMHGTFGALVVEPPNSTWLDPHTGEPIEVGQQAMIVGGDNSPDHREVVLWYQDFVRTFDQPSHEPINGPFTKDLEDQGVMGVNYANAPLFNRDEHDPAYAFSSLMHQDPQTPLIEAYVDDPVQIRLLQGSFEEAHSIMVSGYNWPDEYDGDEDPKVANQVIGVSEQFVAQINATSVGPKAINVTDHVYMSRPADDLWTGMWGLFRVWGNEVDHLEPLPSNDPPDPEDPDGYEDAVDAFRSVANNDTDVEPPKAPDPGDPCPDDAPVRDYDVTAFATNISYNGFGDHDPHGTVFATNEDFEAIQDGEQEPKPLVLRANAGECVEVTLHNKLPDEMDDHTDHARVPVRAAPNWQNGNRTSLAPTMLEMDSQKSAGITAGMNFDQTVAPGENITYRWYAPDEVGTVMLQEFGDVRNHAHHGAYGMLIVEPENSTWHDPETGLEKETGPRAVIDPPDGDKFREYAVMMTDGQYVVNSDGTCPVQPMPGTGEVQDFEDGTPCNQLHGDPEDQGYKAVNYRSEPLTRRLNDNDTEHLVFNSDVHGDPATPVLHALPDDPVRFRVGVPADKPRGVNFHLADHLFPFQWTDPDVELKSSRGELIAGSDADLVPTNNAGGRLNGTGDFMYQATKVRNYLEGGQWGIFRVHDSAVGAPVLPLSDV